MDGKLEEKRFLGVGMKFPPQVDRGSGRFMLSHGTQSVKESVYLILMTHQGERWLDPNFGSRLVGYTFMDTSITMLSLMSGELQSLILEQEPRISEVRVDIDANEKPGCLIVNLSYMVAETNEADNLVFPFFLNADGVEGDQYEQL